MSTNSSINIEEDIPVILGKKIEYHQNLANFHLAEVKKLEKMMIEFADTPLSNPHNNRIPSKEELENWKRPWWWKERILKLVKEHYADKEFVNADILSVSNIPNLDDEDLKKNVRYAVSVALRELVDKHLIKSRKEQGLKGYKYRLVQK